MCLPSAIGNGEKEYLDHPAWGVRQWMKAFLLTKTRTDTKRWLRWAVPTHATPIPIMISVILKILLHHVYLYHFKYLVDISSREASFARV